MEILLLYASQHSYFHQVTSSNGQYCNTKLFYHFLSPIFKKEARILHEDNKESLLKIQLLGNFLHLACYE